MKLDNVSKYMEQAGIPGRDAYDLPSSDKRFPDGASCRIEIAGVYGAKILETLIDERGKYNIPVHRMISLGGGGVVFHKQEVRDFAQMAAEDKIEAIVFPGPRTFWDIGRDSVSLEGRRCGQNHRGSDELRKVIADMMRLYDCGIRGFLIVDWGLMWLIKKMQDQGNFPKDVAIKLSQLGGVSSAAGAKVVENLGISSLNALPDLTLPQLAAMRKVVNIPIDFFVWDIKDYSAAQRTYDAPEVARILAPCYLKFEPGPWDQTASPWADEAFQIALMRKRVEWAAIMIDIIHENQPQVKLSEQGPADLHIPKI